MWSAVDRHGRFVKLWSSINFVHRLLYKYIYTYTILYNYNISIPSASRTHIFFFQKQFFLQLWKKTFFLQLCCSLLGKKPTFFSHLVSWHLMIRSLRGFKPLYWYWPWIYPSQYPPSWLYFHPAGFGWQLSQERTRCSRNMSDSISYDHSQSGVVGGLVPTRATPRSINLKHGCIFFHREKMILDCQNATKSSKRMEQMNKIIKNQSKYIFEPFWATIHTAYPKNAKNQYFACIKPS